MNCNVTEFSLHVKHRYFVAGVLKRTALFHQLFSHGKMHSVAHAMAKDLSVPFQVTNAYGHQCFMSSSYLSLKNLQESLEVYIETFKDHNNHEDFRYKLCGQDFVLDLIRCQDFVLDLIRPVVALRRADVAVSGQLVSRLEAVLLRPVGESGDEQINLQVA